MKKVNKFNSELNRFVYENCRKNIIVQDIDMLIRYYDDSNKFRAIEKKHLNESLGKGQKITLIELTKHNIEAFVVFGNAPYKQDNYIYSLHTFNLYKVDSNTLIKFFNNHIEEGGLGKHWVANNKNLYKLSDSIKIEPYNSSNQDAASLPYNENRTVRFNLIDLDEEDIVYFLMIYGSQHFQIKQNDAIEEWNVATYILSYMEDIIDAFEHPLYKRIVQRIYTGFEEDKVYTLGYFLEDDDEEVKNLAIEFSKEPDSNKSWIVDPDSYFITLPKLYGNDKIDILTSVNIFKLNKLQPLYEKNQKNLKNLSPDDVQGIMRLLKVQQRLMDTRKSIAERTNSIILK